MQVDSKMVEASFAQSWNDSKDVITQKEMIELAISTEIVNFKEMNIVGIPCKGLTNMGDKVGHAVKELMSYVQDIKTWNGKPWFGVFQPCPKEVENEELIYFVCVETEGALEQGSYPKVLQQITIPEQRYMVIHKKKRILSKVYTVDSIIS